ncbi:MAG: hypothetical protein R3E66_14845 [bacterium]
MTKACTPFGSFISCLMAILLAVPAPVFAQGFEFGEEEAETTTTKKDDGDTEEEGGGLEFTSDDLSKEDTKTEEKIPQVAIVSIPSEANDAERRGEIQAKMLEFAKSVPSIMVAGPETVLPGLQSRTIEECVTEPICLGAVGDEAQVDRIILTRVKQTEEGLQLDTDYFDVQDRLFIRYDSKKGLGSTSDIVDAVVPSMKVVLDIRDGSGKQEYVGNEDASLVQSIVAYGAAGLAVACLGAGIYFGMDSSSQVDDFNAAKNADGKFPFSQKAAQQKLQDAESSATTANVFYGLAAAMTVTSVVFFLIEGGSDISADQERAINDFQIAPVITEAGAGVGAGFKF